VSAGQIAQRESAPEGAAQYIDRQACADCGATIVCRARPQSNGQISDPAG
jgi:hypothetical protein